MAAIQAVQIAACVMQGLCHLRTKLGAMNALLVSGVYRLYPCQMGLCVSCIPAKWGLCGSCTPAKCGICGSCNPAKWGICGGCTPAKLGLCGGCTPAKWGLCGGCILYMYVSVVYSCQVGYMCQLYISCQLGYGSCIMLLM